MLATLDRHPHARAVLGTALRGEPSHAYLFHGPAGAGKREAARELATVLLAGDDAGAAARVRSGVHPDLTWVAPGGAAEMLVGDIDEPVVAAATRTPFESTRRVFVIERVETLNDAAANRLLKTLEEPPSYAHLILLSDRPSNVMATVVSRCQAVRFEASPVQQIADGLRGAEPGFAQACARLALGDAGRARALAFGDGPALRAAAEDYARACVSEDASGRPWDALLALGRSAGETAEVVAGEALDARVESLPDRERKRFMREGETVARRVKRRASVETVGLGLGLAGLWLRDVACVIDGAPDVVHHSDRLDALRADAETVGSSDAAREAVALIAEAGTLFAVNPGEELLLETVASRVTRVLRR